MAPKTPRALEWIEQYWPLGGIEPEQSGEIPVKTGTTNGANALVKHMSKKNHSLEA